MQTGLRVYAEVWRAYRKVCDREKVRPYQPFEEFLKSAVKNHSASTLVHILHEAAKRRDEGYNAYGLLLLDWYANGKFWVDIQDKDISLEELLLDALKLVSDADLRRRIEETLIERQRSKNKKSQEKNLPPDVKL